ncbi:MAG TPA: zinc ribbon domain-containing protein [Conexivisphaerales archaeon]|nr:zinc ribbon domain-containing protein [Conexivisphaerales archaeon]
MKFCPTCGANVDDEMKLCANCGTDLRTPQQEPLVEKLTIESCGVTFGYMVLTVKNSGTAPLTIEKVEFGDESAGIQGITSGNGAIRQGRVTLQPGDAVSVLLRQPPTAFSGNEYPVVAVTSTGNRYPTSLVWP